MHYEIPVLETKRLILREWRPGDAAAFAELNANPDFIKYLGTGKPINSDESWRVLAMLVGHWVLRGHGLWVVEEKSSGKFVGRVGLLSPDGWPAIEIGWGVHPDFWGTGYALEAAIACGHWAFSELQLDALISIIDPRNEPSKKLALKFGERFDRKEFVKDRECDIYKISKEDFMKKHLLPE